jgi:UDP-N-acetylglucosamine 2-epimerase (non-hydrolysing)
MPEEINRIVTDALADILWSPSVDADQNLAKEGIAHSKIERVGNIMIDSIEMLKPKIIHNGALKAFGFSPKNFGIVTLHRPSNVEEPKRLKELCGLLVELSDIVQIVFPVHPRTSKNLHLTGLMRMLKGVRNLFLTKPLPYCEFMNLLFNAKFALTDSGGIQEETTYLRIPCLTLRENTERPITLTMGTNRLTNISSVRDHVISLLDGKSEIINNVPEMWDGKTAHRVVLSIKNFLGHTNSRNKR